VLRRAPSQNFSNIKKECSSNNNPSNPELTLLTHDLRYEIKITHKKTKRNSKYLRSNNLMSNDKIKKIKKYNFEEENSSQPKLM
jgi:hypothetical protein